MGTTLLGIDLDESPVGGFVERLLSEEELEKLTDGGRDPREESDASDRRGADEPAEGVGATDADPTGSDATAGGDAGTDIVDDAVESDGSDTGIPVGTSAGTRGADTPSPGDERPVGGPVPSPGGEESGDGGWKSKLRPIVLKGTVALAVLAVVGFLAYRYLGSAKDAVGDKLGSDDESASPSPENVSGDVPEARRRAKAPSRDREEYADRPLDETVRQAEDVSGADEGEAGDEGDESDTSRTVRRTSNDSDVGALVGLAALAVVAAAVRKFGEDPPRDPLVDGPADDGDDE